MKHTPEIIQISIVLVGKFAPAIISPAWLAHHKLIGEEDAKKAKIIIHNDDISQFKFDWAYVLALPDKLQITTLSSPYTALVDLVLSLLKYPLSANPIYQLGINAEYTFKFDFKDTEAIGQKLSPRDAWGQWGQQLINPSAESQANGLTTITMRQGDNLTDRVDGSINANVGISEKIKNGIKFFINDHYNLGEEDKVFDAKNARELLEKNFNDSLTRSNLIINGIIEACLS